METPLKIPASALNHAVQALGMMAGYLERQSKSTSQPELLAQAFANLAAMYDKSRLDIIAAMKKPKAPEPGEGYRFLDCGEEIKEGDEIISEELWVSIEGRGLTGGSVWLPYHFRRKIQTS